MSARALSISVVVLSLGLMCSAQLGSDLNSNRFGLNQNSAISAHEGSVVGTVHTIDGHPLQEVRVELRNMTGDVVASTFTNERGQYTLRAIPNGDFEIVASKGVTEEHDRVMVSGMMTQANLRMPIQAAAADGSSTVSVAAMRVPDRARKLFEKANEAMRKGKFDDSKKLAKKALDEYPEYAQALTLRGILEMNDGATAAGIADFERAIKDDAGYALSYVTLGAALNQTGKYQDATRSLLHALALDPSGWQCYYELAKSSLGQGNYQEALKYSTKASEITQDYAPLHLVKAHAMLGLKMYQDAVGELESYLNREPSGSASEAARKALTMAKSFASEAKK